MTTNELVTAGEILAFDEEKREVRVFVLPWDTDAENSTGVHSFSHDLFETLDPSRFVFRQRHQDPPTGRGFEKADDGEKGPGLYMGFKVSRTAAGDEQLTLIRDGVETGVSIAFDESAHEKSTLPNGRTRYTHRGFDKARALEVSTTWKPAYPTASVLSVLEADTVAEAETPAVEQDSPPAIDEATLQRALNEFHGKVQERFDALQDRIAAQGITVPDSLKRLDETRRSIGFSAELISANVPEAFALDDVISSDNLGVIPQMTGPVLGIIDSSRPFLENTTRDPNPPAGENWKFPKITQRPEVGMQDPEKEEVASQKTLISSVDFDMESYAGAGDLSIQLIKRSSPDFLALWLRLLGEQYAIVTDNAAVDALLVETAVVEGTGTFDPASPSFGEAFANGAAAAGSRPGLLPNRIFLSTAALVAFIDAKSPTGGGGTPLYPGLAGIAGMTGGDQSGPANFSMRPVWVPALDDETVDIIIGPSQGFHWTEDGTYTLTADVPSKAGRDVGLVGMIWFAPVYPAAFTTYALAS